MRKYFVVLNNYLYGENRIEKMRKQFAYKNILLDSHHHLVFFELDENDVQYLDHVLPDAIKLKELGHMREEGIIMLEKKKRLSDSIENGDTFIFKGKSYWCGAVNNLDGIIEEVHTFEEARAAEFHHTFLFSPEQAEDKMGVTTSFFFISDKGYIVIDPMGRSYDEIDESFLVAKIREQITILGHKDPDEEAILLEEIDFNDTQIGKYKTIEIYKGDDNFIIYQIVSKGKHQGHYLVQGHPYLFETKKDAYDYLVSLRDWKKEVNPNYIALLNDSLVIHEELNPVLWTKEELLKEEVKNKIIEIVNKFKEILEEDAIEIKIDDIVIVGSNASYNYSKKSDIDIHIITNVSDQTLINVYNAYKTLFKKEYDIKFKGYQVELYVQNSIDDLHSAGIYSLNSGWIRKPDKMQIDQTQIKDINKEVKSLLTKWKEKINKVLSKPNTNKIDELLTEIYNLRESLNLDGEFSIGNQLFKEIRNLGYIKKLKESKIEIENKKLSISDRKVNDMKEPELKNLKALFAKLNAPYEFDFDGKKETESSIFDFDYRIEDNLLKIFDKNEEYNINYSDDIYYLNLNTYKEFGAKKPDPNKDYDDIRPQIREALDKDGFADEVLEWENSVIQSILIPEKLMKDSSPELEFAKKHVTGYTSYQDKEDSVIFTADKKEDREMNVDDILDPIINIADDSDLFMIWFKKEDLRKLMNNPIPVRDGQEEYDYYKNIVETGEKLSPAEGTQKAMELAKQKINKTLIIKIPNANYSKWYNENKDYLGGTSLEDETTYVTSTGEKAFDNSMGGYSIFAQSLGAKKRGNWAEGLDRIERLPFEWMIIVDK